MWLLRATYPPYPTPKPASTLTAGGLCVTMPATRMHLPSWSLPRASHKPRGVIRLVGGSICPSRENDKSSPPRTFAADRKPESTNLGVLPHARPDMGESGAEAWVVRVCRRLWGLICAADEAHVRSGWGKNRYAWIVREGNARPEPHERQMRSEREGLWQGAIAPLRDIAERRVVECARRRRYPSTSVASRMRRTRVRWLATKSPCRTVTWQGAAPCTGIRLSPNRSRTLLRLSAELRRP
jgi:hypothetical protein